MRRLDQSAAANIMIFMADTNDGKTGKTGLTLTVTLSKNGGTFASISPTVTERGNGWYNVALVAADTNTLGDLIVRATGTGADPGERALYVSPLVNILSGASGSGNTYIRKGGIWGCKRGDYGFNIPFDCGMDITGCTLKWAMSKNGVAIVNPTVIDPNTVSSWSLGTGVIPITDASQTEHTPGDYDICVEITKTGLTLEPWDATLKIRHDIIRPAV